MISKIDRLILERVERIERQQQEQIRALREELQMLSEAFEDYVEASQKPLNALAVRIEEFERRLSD